MPYNLTGIADNSTTLLGFVQGVNNTLMLGWLGVLFLIGLAIVLYTSFIFTTGDSQKSMVATGAITLILCLLFAAVGLINNPLVILVVVAGSAMAIAFSWKER